MFSRRIQYFIAFIVVALLAGYISWRMYHPDTYDVAPLAETADEPSRTNIKSEASSWPTLSFNANTDSSGKIDESARALQVAIVPESLPSPHEQKYTPDPQTRTALSETEYFARAYPDYFIDTLREWQTLVMRNSSLISAPHSFTSEQDIFAFYETFLDFLASKGHMTASEAAASKQLLRTDFKNEKDKERALMSLLPTPRDNLAWLKRATAWLLPEKAFAIMWQSAPLCYKQTGVAIKGVVLPAPSCNAGATAKGAPIPDCGERGAACAVPFGCLNAVCKTHPNAIFDLKSRKCGCG